VNVFIITKTILLPFHLRLQRQKAYLIVSNLAYDESPMSAIVMTYNVNNELWVQFSKIG